MKRKIFYLFILTAVSLCVNIIPSGTSPSAMADIKDEKEIFVFAGNCDFAPYSYISENYSTGYSVDLIRILSAVINTEISIKLLPWEKCLSELKNGTIDGLIGTFPFKEYQTYADYSRPIADIDFAIFAGSDNCYINSISSLEGAVTAVHKDCFVLPELLKNIRIKVIETDSVEEALTKLKNRETAAVVSEKEVALHYIQKNKIHDLRIASPLISPDYKYVIAVRKDHRELLKDINKSILILENNGTLERLKKKWFGLIIEPFPWKMVSFYIGGITAILLLLMGFLWVISLNATLKIKTRQLQIISREIIVKDKLAVLGKLAGQIAHELRTPLGTINNIIYLMRKEDFQDKDLFEKRLCVLENKIKLFSNILESILSYSRIKAEIATAISVKECLNEVLKDIEIHAGIQKDVSFIKEEHLFVFMDFHQLYSVFRNIILNAIQAMDKKGNLNIEAFPSDDLSTITIRIADTGCGIPEDIRGKIFDLFYSSKITGTGLGLPISKSIIETNHGRLILEKTDSKGTSFRIQLPSLKTLEK